MSGKFRMYLPVGLALVLLCVLILSSLSAAAAEQYYTVQRGDSLYKIAQKTGTTVKQLIELNNLGSTEIYPGQKLFIGSDGTGADAFLPGASADSSLWDTLLDWGKSYGWLAIFAVLKLLGLA